MKLIPENISQKFYYYALIFLSFSIPIHNRLTSSIVVIIGLFWLFEFNFGEKFRRVKNSKINQSLFLFSILFFLFLIGLIYSDNMSTNGSGALFNLEKRMSFLGFPLLLATIDIENIKKRLFKQIFKAFILGCLLSSFFLMNVAFFDYMQTNDIKAFYYSELSEFHHPSYLALYFSFAIAILLNWLLNSEKKESSKRNAVYLMILGFQLMIVLLSSKAGILGLALTYFLSILYLLIKKNSIPKIKILIPAILLISFIITLVLNPHTLSRFYSAEKAIEQENIDETQDVDGTVARIIVWQNALEVIKENPIFGVGTGDTKEALLKKYKEKNIYTALEYELNAHNEYLQTFMAIGILGFLVLVLSFMIPAWFAFRRNSLVYLLFLAMLAFHFLVESMLAKQAGIVFYAFFNVILYLQAFKVKGESS